MLWEVACLLFWIYSRRGIKDCYVVNQEVFSLQSSKDPRYQQSNLNFFQFAYRPGLYKSLCLPYNPGNSVQTSNRRCDCYIDSEYKVALLSLVGNKISEQLYSFLQGWKFLILLYVDVCKDTLKVTWFLFHSKDRCYALHDLLSRLDEKRHISEERQGRAKYSDDRGNIFHRSDGFH
jgi:hypothetical protein